MPSVQRRALGEISNRAAMMTPGASVKKAPAASVSRLSATAAKKQVPRIAVPEPETMGKRDDVDFSDDEGLGAALDAYVVQLQRTHGEGCCKKPPPAPGRSSALPTPCSSFRRFESLMAFGRDPKKEAVQFKRKMERRTMEQEELPEGEAAGLEAREQSPWVLPRGCCASSTRRCPASLAPPQLFLSPPFFFLFFSSFISLPHRPTDEPSSMANFLADDDDFDLVGDDPSLSESDFF